MRMRTALYAVPLLTCLVAGPAHATSCNLLTDPAGDGRDRIVGVISSPALDLLSGDVASGATTVVGVLRLASTDPGALAAGGVRWSLNFSINGSSYTFALTKTATDSRATLSGGSGPVTVAVDATTITWTAPRSAFPSLTTGSVFGNLSGLSFLWGGVADTMVDFSATYTDQAASCVPAA